MHSDLVRRCANAFIKRVETYGRRITFDEVTTAAHAFAFLRRKGELPPKTPEQARTMDPRICDAVRIGFSQLCQWATGEDLARFQRMVNLTSSIPHEAPSFAQRGGRRSPAPICGWSPTGPRGFRTKAGWRRAAAG